MSRARPARSSFRRRRFWTGAAAATLLLVVLIAAAAAGGFDSGSAGRAGAAATGRVPVVGRGAVPGAPAALRLGAVQVVPSLALAGPGSAGATRALPAPRWAVSFDVRLSAGSELKIGLGSAASTLVLKRGRNGSLASLVQDRGLDALRAARGWPARSSDHIELTGAPRPRLNIDGKALGVRVGNGRMLSFRIVRGQASVSALIISAAEDRAALLFHRLAELHARVPLGLFPIGADSRNLIHFERTWTIGFWPGALWQAAAIEPAGGMFARWALEATVDNFGTKPPATHDVGFMYGESWQAGWQALCQGRAVAPTICPHLKSVALAAADELLTLAATNPGSGTIPTNATSAYGDTIIDSTMNLGILTWASRVTGNPVYDRLASHHAHVVASLLVRGDGSTAQAVNFDRRTGTVLSIGTHQGRSNTSTWSRGQAWAVYGFAQTAAALHDPSLLRVALRVADYVAAHLPANGVPLWDYDAPAGAPLDVSAGVITAAGLLHLAAACRELPGVCSGASRWTGLARRMLASSLALARDVPPMGYLAPQLLNQRHPSCWCNHGELIFGLTYALEAMRRGGVIR